MRGDRCWTAWTGSGQRGTDRREKGQFSKINQATTFFCQFHTTMHDAYASTLLATFGYDNVQEGEEHLIVRLLC